MRRDRNSALCMVAIIEYMLKNNGERMPQFRRSKEEEHVNDPILLNGNVLLNESKLKIVLKNKTSSNEPMQSKIKIVLKHQITSALLIYNEDIC